MPDKKTKHIYKEGPSQGLYGLGFLGALVYYISNAPNFLEGAIGFLKSLVWPAFLVFEVLKYLGA